MKKKQRTYTFIDYLFHNQDKCPKPGIYFYDSAVLFGWDKNEGVKSYHFRVQMVMDGQTKRFDRLMGHSYEYELLDFIYTCDLKDFTRIIPRNVHFDLGEREDFDWAKLVEQAIPERLEDAKQRLIRKTGKKVPKPIIYKEGQTGFRENNEFLWFTEASCWSWAGPFSLDERKGCIMCAEPNKHYKNNSYPVLNVVTDHTFYDIPFAARKKLFGNDNGNEHYKLTPEQKAEFFNKLTVADKHATAKSYYNGWRRDDEMLEQCLPYRVYLAGNDDCSYTKWFATEKEMKEEVKYLRKMQPLDFYLDVIQRGYIFTN